MYEVTIIYSLRAMNDSAWSPCCMVNFLITLNDVQEFFHCELKSGHHDLPRIFGMTASPIKSKGMLWQ